MNKKRRTNYMLVGAGIGAALGIGIALAAKKGTGGKVIFTALGLALGGGAGVLASAT
jgi:hypothetical protein